MSRRNLLIVVLVSGLALLNAIGLFMLAGTQKEATETQRRIQFEQRASEIRTDIKHRTRLLKEKWQADRQRVLSEGLKLVKTSQSPNVREGVHDQIAQWLKNVDANYQAEEVELIIEEIRKITQLRKQIWGNEYP